MGIVRTLASSALVGAAGSVRAGVGVTELALSRAPSLVALAARATVARGADATRAQSVFRDELLALLDDAGEMAWRQARRARVELGERTYPRDGRAPRSLGELAEADGAAPHRRHRVKA